MDCRIERNSTSSSLVSEVLMRRTALLVRLTVARPQ